MRKEERGKVFLSPLLRPGLATTLEEAGVGPFTASFPLLPISWLRPSERGGGGGLSCLEQRGERGGGGGGQEDKAGR